MSSCGKRLAYRTVAAVVAAAGLLVTGCDSTVTATLENGAINMSTSFITSLFQALVQVYTTQ